MRGTVSAIAMAALELASCGKREQVEPSSWHVVQGVAPFLMRGKVATLRGNLREIRADLQVDFADVTRTRGTIAVDLLSLTMTSFENTPRNEAQTRDAFPWLGLVRGADHGRWATYTIREIASADPKDLTSSNPGQRRTRVTAKGDLTLHGHTAPCDALLEATVAFEGARGRAMHLRTVDDISIRLDTYEVAPPKEGVTQLDEEDRRIVDGLAGTADVALDLALEPVGH